VAVALGQLLDRPPVGDVADQQAQLLQVGDLGGDGLEAGQKKVADGQVGAHAVGHKVDDLWGQGPVTVVNDVVTGHPSCAHGLESDVQMFWRRHCKVEFLKADHSAGAVFDQDHLVTGFLTDVFTLWIAEPDGQRIASTVVKDFYLLHIRSPSLIAKDQFLAIRKANVENVVSTVIDQPAPALANTGT
jgi:hypothetical protein